MDYNTWRSALFDDTYPKAILSHGEIIYGKKNPDLLTVKWGDHEVHLNLKDFYQGETESPLTDIKKWVYSHMPVIKDELHNTLTAYNTASNCYDAFVPRPMGHMIPLRNINPEKFPTFGSLEVAKRSLTVEMDGTVLCMYTKDKKIPSTLAVSHKEVFVSLVNEFIDYDDNLAILLPDSINANHVFAGHADSIMRLAENFSDKTTVIINAGTWFNKLELQRKGKDV